MGMIGERRLVTMARSSCGSVYGRVCPFVVVIIVVVYQVDCHQPATSRCGVDGFDFFNLTVGAWFLNLGQYSCLHLNQPQPLSQCTLDMAICHSFGISGPCQNSSVCLFSDQRNFSLGAYNEDPLGPLATPNSSKGFQAVFTDGSQYITASGTPCLFQTSIVFLCNVSAVWETPYVTQSRKEAPIPKFMSYSNETCQWNIGHAAVTLHRFIPCNIFFSCVNETGSIPVDLRSTYAFLCQLSLVFDFAGACKRELISGGNVSTGTILVVIFFVSVILYFTFGAMINLARGHVGTDVIPHARFWIMLPVYISDGFQFVFCCGQLSVTATYEQI